MTRHSIIALREEARRIMAAMLQCRDDESIDHVTRAMLICQMVDEFRDVRKALITLGGMEALETIMP